MILCDSHNPTSSHITTEHHCIQSRLTQDGRSYSLSRAAYANKMYDGNLSEFQTQENVVPMEVLKEDPFKNSYTNQNFESDEANHNTNTVYERELKTFLGSTHKMRAKEPVDTGEYLEPEQTFHSPKKPDDIATAQVVYDNVSYSIKYQLPQNQTTKSLQCLNCKFSINLSRIGFRPQNETFTFFFQIKI